MLNPLYTAHLAISQHSLSLLKRRIPLANNSRMVPRRLTHTLTLILKLHTTIAAPVPITLVIVVADFTLLLLLISVQRARPDLTRLLQRLLQRLAPPRRLQRDRSLRLLLDFEVAARLRDEFLLRAFGFVLGL